MKTLLCALCVLVVPATVRAVDPQAPGYREVERLVAVVNDDVVLLSEVEEQLVPMLGSLPASTRSTQPVMAKPMT